MIKYLDNASDDTMISQYPQNSIERKTYDILSSSSNVYNYNSPDQLKFELDMRKSIIDASLALNKSNFDFSTFRKSECNEDYWERTEEGGFLLKPGVKPYNAINDIYLNSSKYQTECATAMVIVFYKAVLNLYPEPLFNEMFPEIYLMNWQSLDGDLGVSYYRNPGELLPGDCRYFKNPDVNPETPEWQGENAIDLGNGKFYGHGIGIKSGERIIEILNKQRIDDPTESAYLLDSVTRPDFKYLSNRYFKYKSNT